MENLLNESDLNALQINKQSQLFLKEIAKWTKFLSIIGFIGVGLMVVLSFSMSTLLSTIPMAELYGEAMGGSVIFTVVYLLFALLYFFPVFYLYKFSIKLKNSLVRENSDDLTESFRFLKSHYKFIGIFTLIILSLYVLLFIFGLFVALLF